MIKSSIVAALAALLVSSCGSVVTTDECEKSQIVCEPDCDPDSCPRPGHCLVCEDDVASVDLTALCDTVDPGACAPRVRWMCRP